MNKLISIVIPAYNERENIKEILFRIEEVFRALPYTFETILVDDGSTDGTLDEIKNLALTKKNLYFIELSRNFGHQAALKAGLNEARGFCAISLDADLQHPPELLKDMLFKWEEGYDIVYALRKFDKSISKRNAKSSKLFYKFLNSLSEVEIEEGSADFRLMDKKVVDVFRQFTENDPFIRGLVKLTGFKQYAILYFPDKRFSKYSKNSFRKMKSLAIRGITSLSIKPLNMAIYLGFIFSMLSLLYIPYILYSLYIGTEVSGWASIVITIVFFGGLQLIILGILGIYLGKMFIQVKGCPNYIIKSTNLKQGE